MKNFPINGSFSRTIDFAGNLAREREMFPQQFTWLIITAGFLGLVSDLCSEEVKIVAKNEIVFSNNGHFRAFHSRRAKGCPSCERIRTTTENQGRRSQVLNENRFPDSNESQIIDLMVVYESTVKNQAGGTEKINAVIAQAAEDKQVDEFYNLLLQDPFMKEVGPCIMSLSS